MQRQEEQAAVIDLTADDAGPSTSNGTNSRRTTARTQRPPRFAREIIDLVDEDSGRPTAHSESPEIQFISSRALSPPRRLNQHNGNSDQDDVEFVAENRLPVERRRGHLRNMMADVFDDLERERDPIHFNQFNHLRARLQEVVNNGHPPIIPRRAGGQDRREGRIRLGFVAPTMNFEMVGFDMGFGAGPVVPPPVYDKPEAAPEGFTRSPEEDDTIICPNCRDDLCLGDSDLKKQVWIVKGCGHVGLPFTPSLSDIVLIIHTGLLRRVHCKSELEEERKREGEGGWSSTPTGFQKLCCGRLREENGFSEVYDTNIPLGTTSLPCLLHFFFLFYVWFPNITWLALDLLSTTLFGFVSTAF